MKVLKKILGNIAALLIGLIIVELLLVLIDPKIQILGRNKINDKGGNIYVRSELYHHDYAPDQVFTRYPSVEDDFGKIENSINEQSMRGPVVGQKTKPRILLLGDSFLESEEVEYEQTVGVKLGEKLPDCEVIQKGMSSWSPLLELNWLLKMGLDFEPNAVVLFLCINDFYGNGYTRGDWAYTQQTSFDSDGLPVQFTVKKNYTHKAADADKAWYKQFRTYRILREFYYLVKFKPQEKSKYRNEGVEIVQYEQTELNQLMQLSGAAFEEAIENSINEGNRIKPHIKHLISLSRPQELWDSLQIQRVNLSFHYLEKIDSILSAKGSSLVLAMTPLGWNVALDETVLGRKHYKFEKCQVPMGGIEERIKQFCNEKNIAYLDIYERFKAEKATAPDAKLFYQSDPHWNPKGHSIVADLCATYFSSKNNALSSHSENKQLMLK